jgi:hypothetical protein
VRESVCVSVCGLRRVQVHAQENFKMCNTKHLLVLV